MDNQLYNFKKSDFKLFDSFGLHWRFTEPKYNLLPKDAINNIYPLNDVKISQLYEHVVTQYWDNYSLQKDKVDIISQIDIELINKNVDSASISELSKPEADLIKNSDAYANYFEMKKISDTFFSHIISGKKR